MFKISHVLWRWSEEVSNPVHLAQYETWVKKEGKAEKSKEIESLMIQLEQIQSSEITNKKSFSFA